MKEERILLPKKQNVFEVKKKLFEEFDNSPEVVTRDITDQQTQTETIGQLSKVDN